MLHPASEERLCELKGVYLVRVAERTRQRSAGDL